MNWFFILTIDFVFLSFSCSILEWFILYVEDDNLISYLNDVLVKLLFMPKLNVLFLFVLSAVTDRLRYLCCCFRCQSTWGRRVSAIYRSSSYSIQCTCFNVTFISTISFPRSIKSCPFSGGTLFYFSTECWSPCPIWCWSQ